MTTPFGVDAADKTVSGQDCSLDTATYTVTCTPLGSITSQVYDVTFSSLGQVKTIDGVTLVVGSLPTTVKSYAVTTTRVAVDSYGGYRDTTKPSRAIVTNFGSNTVSILDLINNAVINTISVGTHPVTATLNNNQTRAYVANRDSSSISEIDLNANTQVRVIGVGTQPAALAMDPSGTALWVGGLNYISKVDLSSFSVIQTFSVSGQVTSLAVSAGQNSLVYTTVATAGGSTTFQAQQAAISNAAIQGTYAQYTMSSSSYYAQAITTGGPAPGAPGWLMSSGALVSANYGNGAAVVGTPTGFAVIDLVAKTQIMQGNTPSAVRGIATNPSQGLVYITAPDSNSVLSVPLPKPESRASDQTIQ
jgi:YVTN family beta-propeller protein